MWPTLFTIPILEIPIRSYGLMLMIGFLGGTWWAANRAVRVKCDPDLIINAGFLSLLASVVGARAFYVIHYWERFEGRGLWPVIDISSGGMEFYGGLIGAFVAVMGYLLVRKVSIRLYLDIMAPSLMFGMSMARIGCFLNGCCWGAVCAEELPWAVQFPYASPAMHRQWEERQATLPAELIYVRNDGRGILIPRDAFLFDSERGKSAEADLVAVNKALNEAKASGADAATLQKLREKQKAAQEAFLASQELGKLLLVQAEHFDMSPAALADIALSREHHTHTVHPVQLYASINGMLCAILLHLYFHRRRHHGTVIALLFVLYPVMRFIEEIIRTDNPHDTAGLTISQFISLVIFLGGIALFMQLRRMPPRCSKSAIPAR